MTWCVLAFGLPGPRRDKTKAIHLAKLIWVAHYLSVLAIAYQERKQHTEELIVVSVCYIEAVAMTLIIF
jgi:hypothetical protein